MSALSSDVSTGNSPFYPSPSTSLNHTDFFSSIAETIPAIAKDVLRNEPLFIVFDATAMLISIGVVTILHPCYFFPYLGLSKSKKSQGKVYEGIRMESNSALIGRQQHQPQQRGYA